MSVELFLIMSGIKSETYVISIDIGGTKSAVSLVSLSGQVLRRESEPTRPTERTPFETLESLVTLTKEIIVQSGIAKENLIGVGVSAGGPLDRETGTLLSPPNLPGWEAVPVKCVFEELLNLPVRVENDANATALAEWHYGAGRGARNIVFMTIGTGIGAGLILDGKLYHGTNDLAGELGHQTILMNGPPCLCGKRGCLEALASGPAIARLARESMMYGRHKRVLALAGGNPNHITATHVVDAAKKGDPFALGILEEAGTYLGVGLANTIMMLNPEKIILGTLVVHAGDLLLTPARAAIAEYAWKRAAERCEIMPAALGDRAQDLAGAALWL